MSKAHDIAKHYAEELESTNSKAMAVNYACRLASQLGGSYHQEDTYSFDDGSMVSIKLEGVLVWETNAKAKFM
jgi:hypothetical protein